MTTTKVDGHPDLSTLDAAWRLYHHGSLQLGAALGALEDAGVLLAEARCLLDAPQPPSQGYLAELGVGR